MKEGGGVNWMQWLSERSFGEVICLILVVGMVVAAMLRALTGRGA